MLSLRSLAFILCSAIRRARALSCAALHCFPDILNGRKMAENMAAPMCSLPRKVYTSQGDHGSGRKGPVLGHLRLAQTNVFAMNSTTLISVDFCIAQRYRHSVSKCNTFSQRKNSSKRERCCVVAKSLLSATPQRQQIARFFRSGRRLGSWRLCSALRRFAGVDDLESRTRSEAISRTKFGQSVSV